MAQSTNELPVSVVVTTNHESNAENPITQRPDNLLFLEPHNLKQNESLLCASPNSQPHRERRGSKSCLRVISNYDNSNGAGQTGLSVTTPTRRRSVHFDASPASTVEVPSGDVDKAQRGCGALSGPAPFVGGKEVYVAAAPADEEDVGEIDEETKRLALAKAIARRQSGGPPAAGGGVAKIDRSGSRVRLLSPPPPPIDDNESEEEEAAENGT